MDVHVSRRVGSHVYDFYEVHYGGTRRGIRVIINGVPSNNSMRYRLGEDYDPHSLDVKWYLDNTNTFYWELGSSIAQRMESTVADWRHIRWLNATHARIHGIGYHAIREDLY